MSLKYRQLKLGEAIARYLAKLAMAARAGLPIYMFYLTGVAGRR